MIYKNDSRAQNQLRIKMTEFKDFKMQTSGSKFTPLLLSTLLLSGSLLGLNSCSPRNASYMPGPNYSSTDLKLEDPQYTRSAIDEGRKKKPIVPPTVVQISSETPKTESSQEVPQAETQVKPQAESNSTQETTPTEVVDVQESPSEPKDAVFTNSTKPTKPLPKIKPVPQEEKTEIQLTNPDLKDLLARANQLPTEPANNLRSSNPKIYKKAVSQKRILKGMNRKEIIASWGFFHDLQQLSKENSLFELFIYENGKRVYLKDGFVFAWTK